MAATRLIPLHVNKGKGIVVTPYYTCSFIFEVIVFAVCYVGAVAFRIKTAGIYISMQLINARNKTIM